MFVLTEGGRRRDGVGMIGIKETYLVIDRIVRFPKLNNYGYLSLLSVQKSYTRSVLNYCLFGVY